MRLSGSERAIIKESARKIFGSNTKIFLFGSRIDDSRKGGDIDLYIEAEKNTCLQDKISFTSILKWNLGDQRIDVLVNSPNTKDRKIFHIARKTGVEL
jgi:uncharacterized protein